jgi:hypothetical protein
MMRYEWSRYEGEALAGCTLKKFLGERDARAFFVATPESSHQKKVQADVLVQVVPAGDFTADAQAERWQVASEVSHPHLMSVQATGRADLKTVAVCYCRTALPEDDLSEALGNRTLAPQETLEVGVACARALRYLHRRGLLHGGMSPENVFFVDGRIQLAVDSLVRGAEEGAGKADVGQLAATLTLGLTGSALSPGQLAYHPVLAETPKQLREFLLATEESEEWTSDRVLAVLAPGEAAEADEGQIPTREEPAVEEAPPMTAKRTVVWVAAAVALALIALLVITWRNNSGEAGPDSQDAGVTSPREAESPARGTAGAEPDALTAPPAAVPAPSAAVPSTPAAPVQEGAAAPERASAGGGVRSGWAVIAATYNSYAAAQKRAQSLARSARNIDAVVYPDEGAGTRYYVVLGSGLSQAEAQRLRKTAISAGAPRDSYVTRLRP